RPVPAGGGAPRPPRRVAAMGPGRPAAGVFLPAAGAGFPPGPPAGKPDMSWHGALHELGFAIVVLSWTTACLVFRRRFAALGQPGWARACLACLTAATVIGAWPDINSFAIRIAAATAVQFRVLPAGAGPLKAPPPTPPAGPPPAGPRGGRLPPGQPAAGPAG